MGTPGSCTGHPRHPRVRPGALSKGSPCSVKSVITPHPEDPRGWGWGLQSDPRMLTWGSPRGPVSPGAWNVRCVSNACLPGAGASPVLRLEMGPVTRHGGSGSSGCLPWGAAHFRGGCCWLAGCPVPLWPPLHAARTFLGVAPHASPARDPPRTPAPGLPERLCPLCRAPRVPRGHLSLEAPSAGD